MGPPVELAWIAATAMPLSVTALVALRITRRTVGGVSAYDFGDLRGVNRCRDRN